MYDEEVYKQIKKLENLRRLEKDEEYKLIYLRIRYYEPLIVTIVDTNELYIETGGVFNLLYRPILLKMISKYSASTPTNHIYSVIENMLKSENHVYMNDFDSNPNIINLKNGLYNIEGWRLPANDGPLSYNIVPFIKHNRFNSAMGGPYQYYLSFIQLPIEYDANAECLVIDKFFEDVFGWETVPDIYEMIGYFTRPTVKYQKCFLLKGETGSGKSTFIDMITQFIGIANIENLHIKELERQFRRANLKSALLNIWDELETQKLWKLAAFKIIVTNDRLGGDRKYIQKDEKWKNITRLLYSTNFLPETPKETGFEFYRRWIIINCKNDFLKHDIRDLEILQKITKPKELSGLFNKAIEGWKRLEERKMFRPEFDDAEKVIWTWELDRNPVAEFVEEKCELGDNYYIERELFHEQCNDYRHSQGKEAISPKMCTVCLKRMGININKDQKRARVNGISVYYGVQLNFEPKKKTFINHLIDKKVIEY